MSKILEFMSGTIFRYIIVPSLVLISLTVLYFKWKHKVIQQANEHEIVRRIDATQREIKRGTEFREKVQRHRSLHPVDDARDSCLLSSTNPAKDCALVR